MGNSILTILILIIPVLIAIWQRNYSKKAAEKKRRAKEDQAAHDEIISQQQQAREDTAAHDRQDEALKGMDET